MNLPRSLFYKRANVPLEKDVQYQYRLIKRISVSANSKIYVAKHGTKNDVYAYKVNRIPAFYEKELDILRSLRNSSYFVNLKCGFLGKHGLTIVMELIEGYPLSHYTRRDNLLPFKKVVEISVKIFSALDYLENQFIIHRDIKPDNIMTTSKNPDFDVKIIDFGLASRFSKETEIYGKCGTILYMAPENFLRLRHSTAMDVWSSSVTIYNLITGKFPFYKKGDTENIVSERVTNIIYPTKQMMVIQLHKTYIDSPGKAFRLSQGVKKTYSLFENVFILDSKLRWNIPSCLTFFMDLFE